MRIYKKVNQLIHKIETNSPKANTGTPSLLILNNLRIFAPINTTYDRVHYLSAFMPRRSLVDTLLSHDSRTRIYGVDTVYYCNFRRSSVYTAVQKIYP